MSIVYIVKKIQMLQSLGLLHVKKILLNLLNKGGIKVSVVFSTRMSTAMHFHYQTNLQSQLSVNQIPAGQNVPVMTSYAKIL